MAFVLIPGPGDAPTTSEDWDKINNVLLGIGMGMLNSTRVIGSNVKRGSIVYFAGAWYVTDADTAISGTASDYVRLTNNAGVISAAFVSSISTVSFNRTWNGWYDSSLRLHIFDEVKAFGAGAITELASMTSWRPNNELCKFLSTPMTEYWRATLVHALNPNWATALQRDLLANQMRHMFGLGERIVLTGSGNYTVPTGVYRLHVKMIGPGADGEDGGYHRTGDYGMCGQELEFDLDVTPGGVIAYAITTTSTIFGSTTATKGAGYAQSAFLKFGYGGGKTGGYVTDGEDGVDGTGGGGGGGGQSDSYSPPYPTGGKGGLGTIILS
jgi:hypothetical protein